jgi:hypothetical protein
VNVLSMFMVLGILAWMAGRVPVLRLRCVSERDGRGSPGEWLPLVENLVIRFVGIAREMSIAPGCFNLLMPRQFLSEF